MVSTTSLPENLDWLLEEFVSKTAGTRSALLTSRDGITLADHNLREDGAAETLSAITSGLLSLSGGAASLLGADSGGVRQIIVELDIGHLFVMAAGDGALLTVLAGRDIEVGQVAWEMGLLVKRVPEYLSVGPRPLPAGAVEPVQ